MVVERLPFNGLAAAPFVFLPAAVVSLGKEEIGDDLGYNSVMDRQQALEFEGGAAESGESETEKISGEEMARPSVEEWEEIHRAFEKGEISPEQATRWTERGLDFVEYPEVWGLYVKFWKRLDSAFAPMRKVWNSILYPAFVQRLLYKFNPFTRLFVDVGIFELKPEAFEGGEMEKMHQKEQKITKWGLRLAALLQPEIRPFLPLLNVVVRGGEKLRVLHRQLKTEILEARAVPPKNEYDKAT